MYNHADYRLISGLSIIAAVTTFRQSNQKRNKRNKTTDNKTERPFIAVFPILFKRRYPVFDLCPFISLVLSIVKKAINTLIWSN